MKIIFNLQKATTASDQLVFVSGSLGTLGQWDLENSLAMTLNEDGIWESSKSFSVNLLKNKAFEYLYMIASP